MLSKNNAATSGGQCTGGKSFNCRHDPHPPGKYEINCYRCKTHMGCSVCCEAPSELICLYCHNWAHRAGVRRHGNVVPSRKVSNVHTDAGWTAYVDLPDDVRRLVDNPPF